MCVQSVDIALIYGHQGLQKSFTYSCRRKSKGANNISIVDTGVLAPLNKRRKDLYNEVGFKNVDWTLCARCVNVRNHVENGDSCEKKTYNVLA
jgi:hypothetical protein